MRRALRAIIDPAMWRATVNALANLLLDPALWIVALVAVTLFIGLGSTVVLILPVGLLVLWWSRLAARLQRARYNLLLDAGIAAPAPVSRTGSRWRQLRNYLGRRTTWKELAHHLVSPLLGAVTAPLTFVAWCVPLALLGLPVALAALPSGRSADLGFTHVGSPAAALAWAGLGLVLLFAAPWIVQGLAVPNRELARTLLGPSEADRLEARVDHLETTRAAVLDAVAVERQRLERDLHDGAQQRLVAVAMGLGMAKDKLDDDPEQARQLVAEAHEDAKRAIAELRDFARGIHPAVLDDRGLDAALSALAARSLIPVHVQVTMPTRPPATTESSAYFIVSEALTNVAKHANANQAWVTVVREPHRLVIDVRDDGRGGADPLLGTGLRGLRDRVAAADGTFSLSSPAGGPTVLQVVLPCAS
jgi:signal transduction histidine kinase